MVVPLTEDLKHVAMVEPLGAGPAFVAGKINFPGGKVEEGESAEHAAARELLEETGIRVAPHQLVQIAYQFKKGDYELTVFTVVVENFDTLGTVHDEVELKYEVDTLRASVAAQPERYVADVVTLLDLALMSVPQYA
jgi:mutator protein MutT